MNFYTLKLYIENSTLKEKYADHIKAHNDQVATKYPNAGFDLLTPKQMEIEGKSFKLNTEIVGSMYDSNNTPVSYFLYPRSSIIKTNYRLANSVGIIDSGYRGKIIGAFDNINPQISNIDIYSRLLQICAPNLQPIIVEIIDYIDETERGSGGFGSTGI